MKIIDRILQYADFKQIKIAEFERNNALSNGYLGKMKQRDANMGEAMLEKIIDNCPDINIEWLITGSGYMLKNELKQVSESIHTETTLMQQLINKDKEINELHYKNGKLEGKIEYLEEEIKKLKENDAKVAHTNRVANIG